MKRPKFNITLLIQVILVAFPSVSFAQITNERSQLELEDRSITSLFASTKFNNNHSVDLRDDNDL